MNAIVFSDIHINNYPQFNSGQRRLNDCLTALDDVYKQAVKNNCKAILFAGDLFDTTKTIQTVVEDAFIARFAKWVEKYPDITLYAVSGNHDHASSNLWGQPAISAITHLGVAFPKNFVVMDNVCVTLEDGNSVFGIPYYRHKEDFAKALSAMAEVAQAIRQEGDKGKFILMIHQTPSDTGDVNLIADTDVSDELYDHFDMVLCGHIHKFNRINKEFLVVGNPLHRDAGDRGQEKGIWLMDLDTPTELRFISRKGRYPEYRIAERGEVPGTDDTDFVMPSSEDIIAELDEDELETENFRNDLPAAELMRNFWGLHSTDTALLNAGLALLNS